MLAQIEITSQQIADQFIAAIEGGSTYWCKSVVLVNSPIERSQLERPWYSDPKLYAHLTSGTPLLIAVTELEPSSEGPEKARHLVRMDDIAAGLRIMAKESGRHFGNLIADEGDAETADVFLQYVALGAIVYG